MDIVKSLWNKRKSVFTTMLFSYLFLIIILLTIGGFFYNRIEKVLTDNVNQYQLAMLDQFGQTVDGQLGELERLLIQVSSNISITALLDEKNVDQQGGMYRFIDLTKELSQYKKISSSIAEFYIYLNKSDIIIGPSFKAEPELYYREIYGFEGISSEKWYNEVLKTFCIKKYMPSMKLNSKTNSGKNMITFINSLPYGDSGEVKGSLVVLLDEEKIKKALEGFERIKQGEVYILDDHNQLIMTTAENKQLPGEIIYSLQGADGIYDYKGNGEDMMISYVNSTQTKWKYVSMVPQRVVMEKARYFKNLSLAVLALCILLGIGVTVLFVHRNYKPVRDILRLIQYNGNDSRGKYNEYDIIKNSFKEAFQKENMLARQVGEQKPVVVANYLSRLLKGYADVTALNKQSLKFMDLKFISTNFIVMLVSIDDCSGFVSEDSERDWTLARFIISNIGSELINAKDIGYSIELDKDCVAILVNLEDNSKEDVYNRLKNIADSLNQTIYKNFNIITSIGIGNIHEELGKVHESYREAVQALDYKILAGQGSVIFYKDIASTEKYFYYPTEVEAQIINLVKTGEYDKVEEALNQVFETNFKSRRILPEIGKCLYYNILSTLVKIMSDINFKYESFTENDPDILKGVMDSATFDEMEVKLKGAYRDICAFIKSSRSDQSEQLISNIEEYIESYYSDSSLSLTLIAEQLDITPQYLSFFYKKHKGQNLIDYITRVRIEKAKNLLADKQLTILQVAHGVGYSNDIGLIRVFKKYEGITPGKYRQNLDLKEQI